METSCARPHDTAHAAGQFVVDQDGTADMRHARVGVVYDVVFHRLPAKAGKAPSLDDERRSTGMVICQVVHSKAR